MNLLTPSQCLSMLMTIPRSYCVPSMRPVYRSAEFSACGILNHEWLWAPYLHLQPKVHSECSLLCRLLCDCAFTRTTLHHINRTIDRHCASCGAVEDLYHILFSCDEYHDYCLPLFTSLKLAGRPHTTFDDLIFPTGTEHQCTLMFWTILQFCVDTGLNLPLCSCLTADIFDVLFCVCFFPYVCVVFSLFLFGIRGVFSCIRPSFTIIPPHLCVK